MSASMKTVSAAGRALRAGPFVLALDRPLVMGIVNVTPDSFSDGGRFFDVRHAVARAEQLVAEGADLIDVGGESTRPGAADVSWQDELARVAPIVDALASRVPVSVDTSKPEVMRSVLRMGAAMINDVRALQAPGALQVVAESDAAVCLMHMQGLPRTMQLAPTYGDVVAEVSGFLRDRAMAAEAAGIARDRIVLDPGFGFGKSPLHNLRLLRELFEISRMGWPVLAGLSRKSFLGRIVDRDVADRQSASVASALLAVERGATLVRVHDVAPTRDALEVWRAVNDKDYTFDER
jgi:dihydropteroate synthase